MNVRLRDLVVTTCLICLPAAMSAQSKEHELAERILTATRFEEVVLRTLQAGSASDSATAAKYRRFLQAHLDTTAVRARMVAEYVASYSSQELEQLAIFFESPIGQKHLLLQPQFTAALQPFILRLFNEHGEEYRRDVLGMP